MIAGKSEIIDLVDDGVAHAGTYNGNPIALSAAKATLDVLSVPGTHDRLGETTSRLANGVRSVLAAHNATAEIRHMPGLVQILPGAFPGVGPSDFNNLDWATWADWSEQLVGQGLHVLPKGRLFVSTVHSVADIDATVTAFDKALTLYETKV